MSNIELSPARRFDQVWKTVTLSGAESVRAAITAEDGAVKSMVLRAYEEPHVAGSLRPRARTLEVLTGDIKVASLTDGRAVFSSGSEYVFGVLSAMENIISAA